MIWEYKTAINKIITENIKDDSKPFSVSETDQFLNIMGQDNWELVDVNPISVNSNTAQFVYFFKRPMVIKASSLPDIGFDIDNNDITGSQR
jgi:Domain of unknown function (DUF4177)